MTKSGVLHTFAISRMSLHFRGFFHIRLFALRLSAGRFVQVLCRILCRFGKVVISHLKVAVLSHSWRVANPCTNHMQWVNLCQFCLSRAAKILEELGPRFQPGTADNLQHL